MQALLGALCFSLMGLMVQRTNGTYSESFLLISRALAGIILLGFFYRATISSLFRRNALHVWQRSFFGAISVGIYFLNLRETTIGIATILADLAPVLVVLMLIFKGAEPIRPWALLGALTCVAGISLLASPNWADLSASVVLTGTLGALAGACAYISLKKATKSFSTGLIVWAFSVGLLVFGVVAAFVGTRSNFLILNSFPLIGLVTLSLLAQWLMTLSYKNLPTSIASCAGLTACVWGVLVDVFFLHVSLSLNTLVSIGLIFIGVVVVQVFGSQATVRRVQAPTAVVVSS